jgi:hypothetical protein
MAFRFYHKQGLGQRQRPVGHQPAIVRPIGIWHPAAFPCITPGLDPPSPKADPMTDAPPDRLSNDPRSPHYDEAALARGVGIKFKGAEKTNVEEYCVSEGWIRVALGKSVDRRGNPLTMTLRGPVEPYFRDEPDPPA